VLRSSTFLKSKIVGSGESLNATIKRKVNFKESEWPQYNESMRELVLSQRDEVIRSLSGRGQYRVEKEYAHVVGSALG